MVEPQRPPPPKKAKDELQAKDELLEGKEELVPMDVIDCVDERGAKEELVPQEELVPMEVNEQGQDQESREDAGPEPGRCTVCGELGVNIPFPYCLFCTDTPCYHHGRHCPVRRRPGAQRAAPQAREPARGGSEPARGGPGRCTVCGELNRKIPFPDCRFCPERPCYHHGKCCPNRRQQEPRKQQVPVATPAADASMHQQEPASGGPEPADGGSGGEKEAAPTATPVADASMETPPEPQQVPPSVFGGLAPAREALTSIAEEEQVGEHGQGCSGFDRFDFESEREVTPRSLLGY